MESSARCGICSSSDTGQDSGRDFNVCNACGAHQVRGGWQAREPGKTSYKGIQWPGVETENGFVPTRASTKSTQSPASPARIKK